MTEIDFYILQEDSLIARDHFACRLAEKAIALGRHVFIAATDTDHAESLSQYLWSFKPESFIPNQQGGHNTKAPVVINWQEPQDHWHDVIINLQHQVPSCFSHFKKLAEIVVQEPTLLPKTREHFQFYRDRGYPLKSHKIS